MLGEEERNLMIEKNGKIVGGEVMEAERRVWRWSWREWGVEDGRGDDGGGERGREEGA